jgi:CRISPR-associated protein Cas2
MASGAVTFSGFKRMWLVAMFDVPVTDSPARRAYRRLFAGLRRNGFLRLQYSVYARHFCSEAAARPVMRSLQSLVPRGGEVRLLLVTERQYERMWIFQGRKRVQPEEPLPQLVLI